MDAADRARDRFPDRLREIRYSAPAGAESARFPFSIPALRGLVGGNTPGADDRITQQLRALEDSRQRMAGDLVKAYADLDDVLTPWQRGRFRLFEDRMTQRKLELLAEARRAAAGK